MFMKNINKKERYQILIFYVGFIVVLVIATTTPHIIHSDRIISSQYAQSLVILFDLILGYILFWIYSKKVSKINQQNKLFENRLSESYKYVGRTHGEMEVLETFFDYLQRFNKDPQNNKNIFTEILTCMLVSVARVDKGMMRFIDVSTGRTVTEFFFSKNGELPKINT